MAAKAVASPSQPEPARHMLHCSIAVPWAAMLRGPALEALVGRPRIRGRGGQALSSCQGFSASLIDLTGPAGPALFSAGRDAARGTWTVPASGTVSCHKTASQKSRLPREKPAGTPILVFQCSSASQNIRAEGRPFCEKFYKGSGWNGCGF